MAAAEPRTDLVTVTIDDIDVMVPQGHAGGRSREVDPARRSSVLLPSETRAGRALPHLPRRDRGKPKLQIACNTPVADKMVVRTLSDKANEGRRAVLELLLLNHPLDCPICDKGGECDLQDFSMAYGQGASRLADAKSSKPKAVDLGPTIVLDEERCILCLRCVRFDDIVTGERSLRHRRPRRARDHRDGQRRAVRLRLQRQRDRTVPGRRADLEDLPLQIPSVGQPSHDHDLHAVQRRLPDARRSARPSGAAHDERSGGRRDLRRLAVRPRPL